MEHKSHERCKDMHAFTAAENTDVSHKRLHVLLKDGQSENILGRRCVWRFFFGFCSTTLRKRVTSVEHVSQEGKRGWRWKKEMILYEMR